MKNAWRLFIVILITFALLLIGAQVIYRSLFWASIINPLLFFVFSYSLVRFWNMKPKWGISYIPLIILALYFGSKIIDNLDSISRGASIGLKEYFLAPAMLVFLLCMLASALGAYLASGRYKASIFAIGSIILLVFVWNTWIDKMVHDYVNYGNISGKVNEPLPANIKLNTESGNILDASYFDGKTVIMDFWNTGCVVCFKKFPFVDSVFGFYNQQTDIEAFSVNVPLEWDTAGMALKIIRKKGYAFDVHFMDRAMSEKLGIISFPTVLVVKNGQVVYRGSIEDMVEKINTL